VSAVLERPAIDREAIAAALDRRGFAVTAPILGRATCKGIIARYRDPATPFRSTISMARYNFGRGEYKYFDYPLPDEVQALREAFYTCLAPIANEWEQRLGTGRTWPVDLTTLLRQCHAEAQARPTPLLLRYGRGDYNCLHQDLYGPIHFPLQAVLLLSEPGREFDGGELVLVEQRPRMQSRSMVVRLEQGAAAIFPVRERPRHGQRGYHRVMMRHGVSEILAGERYTLGLIFHDAA
jgi:hypothetical protein